MTNIGTRFDYMIKILLILKSMYMIVVYSMLPCTTKPTIQSYIKILAYLTFTFLQQNYLWFYANFN